MVARTFLVAGWCPARSRSGDGGGNRRQRLDLVSWTEGPWVRGVEEVELSAGELQDSRTEKEVVDRGVATERQCCVGAESPFLNEALQVGG